MCPRLTRSEGASNARLGPSASNPPEVACEAKAFAVQAPKFMELATTQVRPLAKEDGQTVIADSALGDKVVIVECSKVRREFAHQLDI